MTINFFIEKHFKKIITSIYILVFLVAIDRPMISFPDSQGYLDMAIYRSPIYPMFLSFLKFISGDIFNTLTLIVQLGLSLFAVNYLITNLKKHIKAHSIWYILLTLVLLIPCFYNENIANRFLSEALAYPLYLLVVAKFLNSFIQEQKRQLLYGLGVLFVLMLTRGQFIYLVPIALLLLVFISYKKKAFKKNSWLFLVILLFPILVSTTDKIYHSVKHEAFVSTPWSGIHLLTPAMYVADKEDVSVFTTEEEKIFFKGIYDKLEEKNLNIHHLDLQERDDETSFYIVNFPKIANHTIFDDGKNLIEDGLSENETFIAIDTLTKKMTMPLVINNLIPWGKLYLKNSINAFGNSKYFFLYIIILVFSFLKLRKTDSPKIKFIAMGSLLTFANIATVAIGIHTAKRYMFYNDWILFLIVFILLDTLLKKQNFNPN